MAGRATVKAYHCVMRRWCLILLICLLPLQSAWATGLFCELSYGHSAAHGTGGADEHAEHGTHAKSADPSDRAHSASAADDCADMHCHAPHAVALSASPACSLQIGASPQPPSAADPRMSRLSSEIDRPNWRTPA